MRLFAVLGNLQLFIRAHGKPKNTSKLSYLKFLNYDIEFYAL
jgi:hypothetical protein